MRVLASAVLCLSLISCSPQGDGQASQNQSLEQPDDLVRRDLLRPFPTATSVRLFVESGKYESDGRPIFTQVKGRSLTESQRAQLDAAVWIETPIKVSDDWYSMDACFIPHHFFRYFDASGRKLGEVQVCFCCEGVAVESDKQFKLADGQRLNGDFGKLKAMISAMGEPTDIECSE